MHPERQQAEDVRAEALRTLRTRVRLTRAALILERLTRCLWPAATLGLLGVSVWLWGVVSLVPQSLAMSAAGLWVLGILILAWRGLRRLTLPGAVAVATRLDGGRTGGPVAALSDEMARGRGEPDAEILWKAHVGAMARRALDARVVWPDLRLARFDPLAVRLTAILAFVSALLFAGTEQPRGFQPESPASLAAAPPVFEGWAEPPFYTGRPTLYLDAPGTGDLELPSGTELTIRLYGRAERASLSDSVSDSGSGAADTDVTASIGGVERGPAALPDVANLGGMAPIVSELPESETDLREVRVVVRENGVLSLDVDGATIWRQPITVIPDRPPVVEHTGPLTATVNGALSLPFRASDDYGVVGGTAEIRLDLDRVDRTGALAADPGSSEPIVVDLPLPYIGNTKTFEETLVENLSDHRYAGLPVTLVLRADDAGGNVGASPPLPARLPARQFFDPLAAALAEQRRDLLWSADNVRRVRRMLRAITFRPEEQFDNATAYLLVRSALRQLSVARSRSARIVPSAVELESPDRDEVAERLWRAALLIEEGDLANARERLERARDRLSAAIEQGAPEEQIAELMQELREALNEFLRELAEMAQRNADQELAELPEGTEITPNDFQDMLDRLQELLEQQRMAEAQELLRQLQGLMENLQASLDGVARPGSGGDRTLDGLRDTLQRQQGLADETFRQLQGNPGSNGGDQQGLLPPPGDLEGLGQDFGGGPPGTGDFETDTDLAARQEALRQLLSGQRQELPSADGLAGGDPLEDAEQAMGQARESLERGDNNAALDEQARAMEALRQGIREIEEARRSQAQGETPGERGGEQTGLGPTNTDPLGRQTEQDGSAIARGGPLSDGDHYDRSREILEEIRRRSDDRDRPQSELDYLRRLLQRF
ncbi:MAG: DUF4175 family protein [Paracoccaceae bacterium]|nr:DUF4175 family protein [Paracoccaceae bacterium]